MGMDPTGHFTILGLLIGIGISLAFEVLEDALDGNGMDHDWKDYLGTGISGAFAVAGGLADAWLSGDLADNGLGKTMLSIAVSFGIGEAASGISSFISNKIQIGKLTQNADFNKKLVKGLGINYRFNKNGKSIAAFTKAIKGGNWTSKMIANSVSSSTSSNITSLLFGIF